MDGAHTNILIDSLAESVLDTFEVEIPIKDIDGLVEKIGGDVRKTNGIIVGAIQKKGEKFVIYIPDNLEGHRRTFAVAHELGHLFLHMGYLSCFDLWVKQDEEVHSIDWGVEKVDQANRFAASLIMPCKKYLRAIEQYASESKVDTGKVAETFGTDTATASYRGKCLGVIR